MKTKHLLCIPILVISLTGCSNDSKKEDVKVDTLTAFHVFDFENTGIATLLFECSTFIGNLKDIEFPEYKLIAGDRLSLKHTGQLITLESFPGQTYLENGELREYHFIQTRVTEVKGTSIETLKSSYSFRSENVILDEEGHYVHLDNYQGSDFYLTFDAERVVPCPEGAWCEDQLYPVAGIYAYNPRP